MATPILKRTYEDQTIHNNWESIYRTSGLQDWYNDIILRDALAWISHPLGCLDVGCGVGDHTRRLRRLGITGRLVGVDISEAILARARIHDNGPIEFLPGTIEYLPFADASFSIVHCRGVLMHIPDWRRAIHELCRVTERGGTLIVMENNSHSIEQRLVTLLRRFHPSSSSIKQTDGGIEEWSVEDGHPFVVRVADHSALVDEFAKYGCALVKNRTVSVIGTGRVPSVIRGLARLINIAGYAIRFPVSLANGAILLFRKS